MRVIHAARLLCFESFALWTPSSLSTRLEIWCRACPFLPLHDMRMSCTFFLLHNNLHEGYACLASLHGFENDGPLFHNSTP
ncbi:hypothetical protein P153DRAFT_183065 [Dothidotthia symphoricarpi CBS 119687]|uniref:Secreted protein n=1 Tax=Dothidotthia symphoricarpi CBS 119687 TaxID=1392245 RepID=A0A6A6ALQ7_9PLEO|nr:uncharacterized protein P153DRAFT_183065 [Dothidotthia symphoricarpi CBS 119687]KAF2132015.1 hypothetical protein P153DRAFT_183065 [Dothidotthia symphoricarpi CBS 119687]